MRQIINHIFYGVLCLFFFVSAVNAQISIDLSGAGGGGIKLGGNGGCDSNSQGSIRYDSGQCFEVCNGEYWECLEGDCDSEVHPFTFTDVTGAATGTVITSNIVQVSGSDVGCLRQIYESGSASGEWRECSVADCSVEVYTWNSGWSPWHDPEGNYIQLRLTSPATTDAAETMTFNVGGTRSAEWTVTTTITGSCGATPALGDVCPDGTIYAGLTPDGDVPMYLARCDLGMSWDGSNCTGTRSQIPWNNDNSSDRTATGYTSSTDGDGNTAGIIITDSDSGTAGVQPHQAAQACADLNVHGHTDWYLPAFYEMDVIWDNLIEGVVDDNIPGPIISGFGTTSYWTSSDASTSYANFFSFSNSGGYGTNKYSDLVVRCARQD